MSLQRFSCVVKLSMRLLWGGGEFSALISYLLEQNQSFEVFT